LLSGAAAQESIDFGVTSIMLRILVGNVVNKRAGDWLFRRRRIPVYQSRPDPLHDQPGISVSASSGDTANLPALGAANRINPVNPHEVTVALDQIQFVDKPGTDFADVTINLQTTANSINVPEPLTLALAVMALAAAARGRSQGHRNGLLLEMAIGDDFSPVTDRYVVARFVGGWRIGELKLAARVHRDRVLVLSVVPICHGTVGHRSHRLVINAPIRILRPSSFDKRSRCVVPYK
jgi:hypothetical protein